METELPDNDKFHEECGVVAVYNHKEAANLAYLGFTPYSTEARKAPESHPATEARCIGKSAWD